MTLEKDAVLAVFGGGKDATTSNGGTAIRLNGGTITGEGKLMLSAEMVISEKAAMLYQETAQFQWQTLIWKAVHRFPSPELQAKLLVIR